MFILLGLLSFLIQWIKVSLPIWKILSHFFFKYVSCPFSLFQDSNFVDLLSVSHVSLRFYFACSFSLWFSLDIFLLTCSWVFSSNFWYVQSIFFNPSNSQPQVYFAVLYYLFGWVLGVFFTYIYIQLTTEFFIFSYISVLTYPLVILNSTNNLLAKISHVAPPEENSIPGHMRPGMLFYFVWGRYRDKNIWGTVLIITTLD